MYARDNIILFQQDIPFNRRPPLPTVHLPTCFLLVSYGFDNVYDIIGMGSV
jgi:hypothetical protein